MHGAGVSASDTHRFTGTMPGPHGEVPDMHISEGVLSPAVLGLGAALTAAGVAVGLRKVDYERLMSVAMLAATFFVGSLVHVPVGPSSAHLVLNGLLGLFLGWAAFPAILVALALQAVLFQYGGITTLGVNTFTMALPAVAAGYAVRPLLGGSASCRAAAGFACGALAVAGAAALTALALGFSSEGFVRSAQILLAAHIPVMVAEGVITALIVSFVARVRPETLHLTGANE